MKTVVFSPVALARLADILAYRVERFATAQAEVYAARLAGRLEALASGRGPRARVCEHLMRGVREASGLTCFRESAHYPILREQAETLQVVEIFHERMNVEVHLERPMQQDPS